MKRKQDLDTPAAVSKQIKVEKKEVKVEKKKVKVEESKRKEKKCFPRSVAPKTTVKKTVKSIKSKKSIAHPTQEEDDSDDEEPVKDYVDMDDMIEDDEEPQQDCNDEENNEEPQQDSNEEENNEEPQQDSNEEENNEEPEQDSKEEENNEEPEQDSNEEENNEDDDNEEENNEDDDNESDFDEDDEDDDDEKDYKESLNKPIGGDDPTIPSQVSVGKIYDATPLARVINVRKLPRKTTKIDLIKAFANYGAIERLQIINAPSHTMANIAFKNEKSATAATADDRKVKVLDTVVLVNFKKDKHDPLSKTLPDERCVFVKNMNVATTQLDIINHFKICGHIANVKIFHKYPHYCAYVTFSHVSSVKFAKELHNSILKGVNINVGKKFESEIDKFDLKRTVLVKNTQNFKNLDVTILESIFSECGEIELIDVLCRRNVLAFIVFKTPEGIEEALKMTGRTKENIKLHVERYRALKKWTDIHVTNIPKGNVGKDLRNYFTRAGPVKLVQVHKHYAVVRFEDTEGFCKSFAYNESHFKGQMIFIQPHSYRTQQHYKVNMLGGVSKCSFIKSKPGSVCTKSKQ